MFCVIKKLLSKLGLDKIYFYFYVMTSQNINPVVIQLKTVLLLFRFYFTNQVLSWFV